MEGRAPKKERKPDIADMLNPWPGVVCPCLPRQHFVIGRGGSYGSALDDGTREGGEPVLLDVEALPVPPLI